MVTSDKHAVIFIHIPKTAGESISNAIASEDPGAKVDRFGPSGAASIGKHSTAMEVRNVIGGDAFAGYFKFAFVRNPWDQAVSFYNHLRKPLYLREFMGQLLHPHNACRTALTHSFGDWVREIYENKQFQDEMTRSHAPLNHFKNQSEWLCDERGNLLVDYVGRYESLDADLAYVAKRTALRFGNLPRYNESRREHYRTYYDATSQAIIAAHFQQDIILFDYAF